MGLVDPQAFRVSHCIPVDYPDVYQTAPDLKKKKNAWVLVATVKISLRLATQERVVIIKTIFWKMLINFLSFCTEDNGL